MFVTLEASAVGTVIGNFIIVTGAFLVLLLLIRKFAWGQITDILDARAQKISDDIDSAEQNRIQAEALANRRQSELALAKDEAGKIIDNAHETGKVHGDKIIANAHEEANRLKEKAQQDIAQSKQEAVSSVKGDVADLTVRLAEKILAKELDDQAKQDLVDRYLDQLGDA